VEHVFDYVVFKGRGLNPKAFGGREPRYDEVHRLYACGRLKAVRKECVAVRIECVVSGLRGGERRFRDTIWLGVETYRYVRRVLGPERVFYVGHEGVSFDVAGGAWKVVGEPKPVRCLGSVGGCVIVETKLGRRLGLGPFIVEREFLFKGVSGEHILKGRVRGHTYLLLPYNRKEGRPLAENELRETLLYRNYLSKTKVRQTLEKASKHMRRKWWHVERMRKDILAPHKVMWRDVAKEFIPAVANEELIPDHNVHYIVTDTSKEAYYLMAILLAPQLNAVVRELSPWVGHVQPRFLRYFRIPKYSPTNEVHAKLAEEGMRISREGLTDEHIKKIEKLVERLSA